jgi:hypothetical protein
VAELTGLEALPRITLAEVLAAASATTRVDRKYLVPVERVEAFLAEAPASLRLLTIGDRLSTGYRSTYFDTADLLTCRAHVQGRRRRWKARSRLYVEDGLCRLELKVRDGSGLTRKSFHATATEAYGLLDGDAVAFLHDQLTRYSLLAPADLQPSSEVAYRRVTLADPESGGRVTIDSGVRASRGEQVVEVDPRHLVVETKGGRLPGVADQLLRRLGERPVSFSKYAASASLMDPRIADNDVRHLLGRQLRLSRSRTTVGPTPGPTPHAPSLETLRRTA